MNNFLAHILVVDDDDGIRKLVKQFLNENNYLVTTAQSAEAVSYTHLRAHETPEHLVCRLLLEKKKFML